MQLYTARVGSGSGEKSSGSNEKGPDLIGSGSATMPKRQAFTIGISP